MEAEQDPRSVRCERREDGVGWLCACAYRVTGSLSLSHFSFLPTFMLQRNTGLLHRSISPLLTRSHLAKSAKLPLPFHTSTRATAAAPTHTSYGLQHLARKAPAATQSSRLHTTAGTRNHITNDSEMGAVATPRVDTTERVEKLRSLMKEHKLDA